MPTVMQPPTYDISAYAVIFIAVLGIAVIGAIIFWFATHTRW
jgi:ABC-type Na+ efflux pump permease subunit